ncbi:MULTISPECIES: hypothetical protein [unclassified Sphingomonas]|uniref:hypothetical protein n=1 Tax=unclassified Sphingomonas TaxID=196159 RepID=UPI0006FF842E|nr:MULTISPECIES: hypothetical protein [unclassified Sphingomonas]KQX18634.1 hypothetical protein ASD17_15990 [Sphingomonas sp. Root1294]KQY72043.1 hypothetical protein ASD39_18985 [Sphingomonas sp. Root50]KRB94688.1 hypothetical protein ASE22_01770 [Sphingomonas sp. Root720]
MDQEAGYHLQRAEAELRLAQEAIHPLAAKAHYCLAGYHLDRAYSGGIEKAPPHGKTDKAP